MLPLLAFAEEWRIHSTFDGDISQIEDTPDFTYFVSNNQPYLPTVAQIATPNRALYRYDKKGDEIQFLSKQNLLSDYNVDRIRYNLSGKYLVVVYQNGNIDLMFDNGDVVNVPGFKLAGNEYVKSVRNINFVDDKVYISTDFGYIVIDPAKGEILLSRNLKEGVNSVGKRSGWLFIGTDNGLYAFPENSAVSLDPEYAVEGFGKVRDMVGMDEKLFVINGEGENASLPFVVIENGKPRTYPWLNSEFLRMESSKLGLRLYGPMQIWEVEHNLDAKFYWVEEEDVRRACSGIEPNTYWFSYDRKGLRQKKVSFDNAGDYKWMVAKDGLIPNAANPFTVTHMQWHPKYGLLVRNHGVTPAFPSLQVPAPDVISAYKNGEWKSMSTTYNVSGIDPFLQWNPAGLAVDPNNEDHVYSSSVLHGLLRLNLADPNKSLRLTQDDDYLINNTSVFGIQPKSQFWGETCIFTAPEFDNNGVLWTSTYFPKDKVSENVEICAWRPADIKATQSASTYQPLIKWEVPRLKNSYTGGVLPLKSSSSKNLLVYFSGSYQDAPALIDHKGTVEDNSDDQVVIPIELIDQDGSKIGFTYIRTMIEDTSTGLVWCGTDMGVFTFRPSELLKTGDRAYRIKVARNDGTNLADYLLDGVSVNNIMIDKSGKKWISTNGGGIVVTSSDGTEIVKTYTTDNSGLPDNDVYAICYNPENNSMMISTGVGLVELFLSSDAGGSAAESNVKAYPNPVRPDYYGYVTIEGLNDNALVKIVDAGGNLIKELGFAAGGEARWDATNLYMKRVPTGVYYVLATGGPDEEAFAKVSKILVVN